MQFLPFEAKKQQLDGTTKVIRFAEIWLYVADSDYSVLATGVKNGSSGADENPVVAGYNGQALIGADGTFDVRITDPDDGSNIDYPNITWADIKQQRDEAVAAAAAAAQSETNAGIDAERSENASDVAVTYAGIKFREPTWALLAGKTGIANDGGYVPDEDAGTHTDPITSATVPNAGVYQWVASGLGSAQAKRVGPTGLAAIAARFDTLRMVALPRESGYLAALLAADNSMLWGINLAGQLEYAPLPGLITAESLATDIGLSFRDARWVDMPIETGYRRAVLAADNSMILGLTLDGSWDGKFLVESLQSMIDNTRTRVHPPGSEYVWSVEAADGSMALGMRRDTGRVDGRFNIGPEDFTPASKRIVVPNADLQAPDDHVDEVRSTLGALVCRSALDGNMFAPLPRLRTTWVKGVNASGTALEFRRRTPLIITGLRDKGTFTPVYDTKVPYNLQPITRYMTTPVLSVNNGATSASALPALSAGDAGTYLFYKDAAPRTAGLNGDTANNDDLLVWTGTQWRVQPRLGTYSSMACGDFFTALSDCWYNGVQLKAGESLVFMGQLGASGRLRFIRARTEAGQFVFRGAFTPASGVPPTPRQGDCWIASAAGTTGGLTFAEGDLLIRDAGVWAQIAAEPRVTVAAGAYVSLRCFADSSEWEVRRVDKSSTRCSISLSTLQQAAPARARDDIYIVGDSIAGQAVGAEGIAFGDRSVTVHSLGGANTDDIVGWLRDQATNLGDPWRGAVHVFVMGNNDGPAINTTFENLVRAIDLIGVRDPRWLFSAPLTDITTTFNGTRIVAPNCEEYKAKTGVAWQSLQNALAAYPTRVLDAFNGLLQYARADVPCLWLPGQSELYAAQTYGWSPLSHHIFYENYPWKPSQLNYAGNHSVAGLPSGGADGDYYIRTGGGTVGNLLVRWAGAWSEIVIDRIHRYAKAGRDSFALFLRQQFDLRNM